jgi:hypothetical protein
MRDGGDDERGLVHGVEGEGGAGFDLAGCAVAGVDDKGWGEEGVADVGAGTAAVEGVLAEGLRAVEVIRLGGMLEIGRITVWERGWWTW